MYSPLLLTDANYKSITEADEVQEQDTSPGFLKKTWDLIIGLMQDALKAIGTFFSGAGENKGVAGAAVVLALAGGAVALFKPLRNAIKRLMGMFSGNKEEATELYTEADEGGFANIMLSLCKKLLWFIPLVFGFSFFLVTVMAAIGASKAQGGKTENLFREKLSQWLAEAEKEAKPEAKSKIELLKRGVNSLFSNSFVTLFQKEYIEAMKKFSTPAEAKPEEKKTEQPAPSVVSGVMDKLKNMFNAIRSYFIALWKAKKEIFRVRFLTDAIILPFVLLAAKLKKPGLLTVVAKLVPNAPEMYKHLETLKTASGSSVEPMKKV